MPAGRSHSRSRGSTGSPPAPCRGTRAPRWGCRTAPCRLSRSARACPRGERAAPGAPAAGWVVVGRAPRRRREKRLTGASLAARRDHPRYGYPPMGTYASAIFITVASLLLGRGVCLLSGLDGSSWAAAPVGFAALMIVCEVAVSLPGHGWTAVIIVWCCARRLSPSGWRRGAALAVGRRWRGRDHRHAGDHGRSVPGSRADRPLGGLDPQRHTLAPHPRPGTARPLDPARRRLRLRLSARSARRRRRVRAGPR